MMQDLRDSVKHAAWPRLKIGVNLSELHEVAANILNIRDPNAAAAWVQERFDAVCRYVQTLKADDAIVHDSQGTGTEKIDGGAFNFDPILNFLRHRIVEALNSLPTLHGINDGNAQTYVSVEWAIYAAGLHTLRDVACFPLVRAANTHLRLLGMPLVAQLQAKPIRTNDDLQDAQTEATKILNAVAKRDQGWIDQEEASIEVTGTGPVGPAPEPEAPEDAEDTEGEDTDDQDPPRNAEAEAFKQDLKNRWAARRRAFEAAPPAGEADAS
jgi:hypothetical protein